MANEEQSISKFLHDIFTTNDEEIHCDDASALMIQSAGATPTHEASQARFPALWRHLAVCSDCTQEYELLLALTKLEATEQLEVPPDFPALPDGGKPAIWNRARDAITAVFPGFAPDLAAAVTRGQERLFAPVAVSLEHGQLSVEFDVAPHEDDPQYRDLYITMLSQDKATAELLDGVPLWLQIEDEGPALYNELLLEADAAFMHISPGSYTLRWQLSGRDWAVMNVTLP